jgi:hypothetical protein
MGKHTRIVNIENVTGNVITDVKYRHTYDDVTNSGDLASLDNADIQPIGKATFWTGFFAWSKDYWWIEFKLDGETYTCQNNFFCYLNESDAKSGLPVTLKVSENHMKVVCPASPDCKVALYTSKALIQLVTEKHEKSGLASKEALEERENKTCEIA